MKKGFTVVELIVSFSLVMVIAIFLFQIVIGIKNLYTNSGLKTELLNKQSLISYEINKKFIEKDINQVLKCGSYCLDFVYSDGSKDQLRLDYDNKTFQFGSYTTKLPGDSYFKDVNISAKFAGTFSNYTNNAMILVNIPIYNDNFENQNFGLTAIYQYNTNENDIYLADFSANDSKT